MGAGQAGLTWRELLARAEAVTGSAQEARWLAEEGAGVGWPALLEEAVTVRDAACFDERVRRRVAGEPLQYVLGHWPFRQLDLLVDRRVLVPRPETEGVVDVALGVLARVAGPEGGTAADLGTGSGAIALSMASERPGLRVWATDRSEAALSVARANLAGLGGLAATRVRLVVGDWWEALPAEVAGALDVVVCNPPYVSAAEMAALDPVVADWEPAGALDGGRDGLDGVRAVVSGAAMWLRPGGSLVVEIGARQGAAALRLAEGNGLVDAEVRVDLAGRDRVLVARAR